MSENKLQNHLENLNDLHNKILAGRAAIDEEEIQNLCADFELELKNCVDKNYFENSNEIIDSWNSVLQSACKSDFVKDISAFISPALYFELGEYLVSSLSKNKTPQLKSLVHNYLDLFRYSQFLTKI